MIKQYLKQTLAQLRQHPLISVVSVVGTAVTIAFIFRMAFMAGGVRIWIECSESDTLFLF